MKFKEFKEFSELEIGDVIWAYPKIGGHIFIITNNINTSNGVIGCYTSINLTSTCPDCQSSCIEIEGKKIPLDWFPKRKHTSYIRLSSPIKICQGHHLGKYMGNLKDDYPELWQIICQKCAPSNSIICDCGC
jgi:hypothetical protein